MSASPVPAGMRHTRIGSRSSRGAVRWITSISLRLAAAGTSSTTRWSRVRPPPKRFDHFSRQMRRDRRCPPCLHAFMKGSKHAARSCVAVNE
jgi:hypothetical protein